MIYTFIIYTLAILIDCLYPNGMMHLYYRVKYLSSMPEVERLEMEFMESQCRLPT